MQIVVPGSRSQAGNAVVPHRGKTESLEPLIHKLEQLADLTDAEVTAITEAAGSRIKTVAADCDLAAEGDEPTECIILLTGMVCRYKLLHEGKRQIVNFQFPGSFCTLPGILLGRMDHGVGTMTPVKVATVPRRQMLDLFEAHPGIARALWRETLIDASIAREWIVNVGGRPSLNRIAHLLCEMDVQLSGRDRSFALPLTQGEIADAMGLSDVHVNRTIQQLRATGVVKIEHGRVTLLDRDRLREIGDFRPDYLFSCMPRHCSVAGEPASVGEVE